MTTPTTGNAREGKYCPRCRTMTGRDREVCEHCGHRFRTGLGTGLTASPLDAPITDEAALHRTMQFTLPPLAPRPAAEAPEPPGAGREAGGPRLRGNAPFALALGLLGLALLGAWGYVRYAQTARAAPPSPVGVWETAPTGRPAQGARLRLTFQSGGGGSFSWAAAGAPPIQAPLRWRLDPDGRLVLSIAPTPATADATSGTLMTVLNSHPWLWRVDRARHRLIVGTLSLTEKS